jgi:hypothetical protein
MPSSGIKNRVRTSDETNYISARETSRLMICRNVEFHDGGCEKCHLMGCYATFRTKYYDHHQGRKNQRANNRVSLTSN